MLDTKEARLGLEYLRSCSPGHHAGLGDLDGRRESRRVFQAGGAVLMRNWPYAFAEAQSPDPHAGPRRHLGPPHGERRARRGDARGLPVALNARIAPASDAAHRFIAHLTRTRETSCSPSTMAAAPRAARPTTTPAWPRGRPLSGSCSARSARARPRPVTPYLPMAAGTLAAEFSAGVTGIRSPAEALGRAQVLVDHLMLEAR